MKNYFEISFTIKTLLKNKRENEELKSFLWMSNNKRY